MALSITKPKMVKMTKQLVNCLKQTKFFNIFDLLQLQLQATITAQ